MTVMSRSSTSTADSLISLITLSPPIPAPTITSFLFIGITFHCWYLGLPIPGLFELELPSPSHSALQQAGLEIVERRQPSLLFDDSVLITGEVDRTTDFEHGMPFHEALTDGAWAPDPLILDDQALIVHV